MRSTSPGTDSGGSYTDVGPVVTAVVTEPSTSRLTNSTSSASSPTASAAVSAAMAISSVSGSSNETVSPGATVSPSTERVTSLGASVLDSARSTVTDSSSSTAARVDAVAPGSTRRCWVSSSTTGGVSAANSTALPSSVVASSVRRFRVTCTERPSEAASTVRPRSSTASPAPLGRPPAVTSARVTASNSPSYSSKKAWKPLKNSIGAGV